MNIAFSTLGCPDWDFNDILSTAKDLGYSSVEIRGAGRDIYAPDIKQFSDENIGRTKQRLSQLGLEICILTSGATLAVYDKAEAAVKEVKAYIDLAGKLDVRYVRVMCTDQPYPDGGDIRLCKKLYTELCEYGKDKGVTPLMETNGMFADSRLLADFLDDAGCGGALWDINHPYRFMGESMATTFENLKGKIRHVHLKDSVVENSRIRYKMMGRGDLPVKEAVELLKKSGYDGAYSLEWVKRWNQELEEPGIVFSHFISYLSRL